MRNQKKKKKKKIGPDTEGVYSKPLSNNRFSVSNHKGVLIICERFFAWYNIKIIVFKKYLYQLVTVTNIEYISIVGLFFDFDLPVPRQVWGAFCYNLISKSRSWLKMPGFRA